MEAKEKRILIVDDDQRILESLKNILESECYSVETAESGEEATKKIEKNSFDIALLDIRLSGMQGPKLLEIQHEKFPRMVKIMMTGYPSLYSAIAALKLRADAYIMKPVNPVTLLDVIKKSLRSKINCDYSCKNQMFSVH